MQGVQEQNSDEGPKLSPGWQHGYHKVLDETHNIADSNPYSQSRRIGGRSGIDTSVALRWLRCSQLNQVLLQLHKLLLEAELFYLKAKNCELNQEGKSRKKQTSM